MRPRLHRLERERGMGMARCENRHRIDTDVEQFREAARRTGQILFGNQFLGTFADKVGHMDRPYARMGGKESGKMRQERSCTDKA